MDLNSYRHWKAFKANQPSGIKEVPGGITEVLDTPGTIVPDEKFNNFCKGCNYYPMNCYGVGHITNEGVCPLDSF